MDGFYQVAAVFLWLWFLLSSFQVERNSEKPKEVEKFVGQLSFYFWSKCNNKSDNFSRTSSKILILSWIQLRRQSWCLDSFMETKDAFNLSVWGDRQLWFWTSNFPSGKRKFPSCFQSEIYLSLTSILIPVSTARDLLSISCWDTREEKTALWS